MADYDFEDSLENTKKDFKEWEKANMDVSWYVWAVVGVLLLSTLIVVF